MKKLTLAAITLVAVFSATCSSSDSEPTVVPRFVQRSATSTPVSERELPVVPSPTAERPMSSPPVALDLPQGVSGVLEHSSGARIAVPKGATAEETTVTIMEVDPPDSPVNVGRVFDFSVGDAYLYEPVTLSIPFELEPGVSASEIQALHWDEEIESWIVLDGEVVESEMAIVVTVADLSLFSTAGPSGSDSSASDKPAFMPWLVKVKVPEMPLVGKPFTIDWWAQNAGGSRLSETDLSAVGYVRLVSPEPEMEDTRIAAHTERAFLPDVHEWNPGRTYTSYQRLNERTAGEGFTVTPTVPGLMTVRLELVFESGDGVVLGSDVVEREIIVTDYVAIRPTEVVVDGETYEVSGLPDPDGTVNYVVRGPEGQVSGTLQDKAVFTAYYQQTSRDSRANAWLMENLGWIKFAARYTQLGGVLSTDVTFFLDQFSTIGSLLLSPNVYSKSIAASHVASELVVKFLKETTKHPEAITEKIALDAYDRSLDILLDEIPPLLKRVRDGNPLSFSEAIWVAENLAFVHAYQKPSMTAVRMIAANNMGLEWDGGARRTFAEQGVHIAGLYQGLEVASDTLSILETASLFNELTPSYAEFEPWQTMVNGIESNLERLSSDYRQELEQIGISDHGPFQHSLFTPIAIPHYTQIGVPVQESTPREVNTGGSLKFSSVSAGYGHTCGVLVDSSVACWGRDEYGESTPPSGEFSSVSAGYDHTCGVLLDGSVACWGNDEVDQSSPPSGEFVSVSAGLGHTCGVLLDGSMACWGSDGEGRSSPPSGEFVSVSAGLGHTCGVLLDGSVACWGTDEYGESTPPVGKFSSVIAGLGHTCGVLLDGSVVCWGSDREGQSSPPSGEFVSVSAGSGHTCGVLVDGSMACWGFDNNGRWTPPSGEFVSVSAGVDHACGVLLDGSVSCWGLDDDGQSSPPVGEFLSVSAGDKNGCGVLLDGSVSCWGWNRNGESTPPAEVFVSVSAGGSILFGHRCGVLVEGSVACWGADRDGQSSPPSGGFTSVSAGGDHTCGLRLDGSVACWGWDEYGQSSPPSGGFTSVSAGSGHTCGLRLDGSVACWGWDEYGQSSPPSGGFTSVSAGGGHTCGVLVDGSVACWGRDDDDQSSPPSGKFSSVSAGYGLTCGVLVDSSLACWGRDYDGRSSAPSGEFVSVSAGGGHTCGVLVDGSVVCWGAQARGLTRDSVSGELIAGSAGK